jgi:ABC-type branched-subunit amino acid transport system ATPase component
VRSETPISIIVVEQNIEFIRSLSDRIIAIQKGKVIAEILDTSSNELENLDL